MNLKFPFEHICVIIHCASKERDKLMHEQICKIGADSITEFRYVDSMPKSFTEISNNIFCKFSPNRNLLPGNEYVYNNTLSCMLNHYWAIKTSYERGFNSVLIMEDDVRWIDDEKMIQQTFDNLPENYKIVKFSTQLYTYNHSALSFFPNGDNGVQEFHKDYLPIKTWGAAGYLLSRKGMEELIEEYNIKFAPADTMFAKFNDENEIYITKYQILEFDELCSKSNIDMLNYA